VSGFPIALLSLVRCSGDAGRLRFSGDAPGGFLVEGRTGCESCGAEFVVRGGILDLLGDTQVADAESAYEQGAREAEAAISRGAPGVPLSVVDEIEIAGTIRHLGNVVGKTMLELGCGAGVYTRLLASSCARILAIDFSWAHLALNGKQAKYSERVGLVRADVSRLNLAPETFDVAFTTLYSNLPSRDLRETMNARVLSALRPGGKYLVSAHHQDLRRRLRRAPSRERYSGSGILFESFTGAQLARELRDFSRVDTVPVAICLPLLTHLLHDPVLRWIERVPVVNLLGATLLADARKA
jgi:SAM-dependent methyltransferase